MAASFLKFLDHKQTNTHTQTHTHTHTHKHTHTYTHTPGRITLQE